MAKVSWRSAPVLAMMSFSSTAKSLGYTELGRLQHMKFALCNEMYGERSLSADTFSAVRKLGYTGLEIAPFTLSHGSEPFDMRAVTAERIVDVRTMAEDAGLEVIGLHWLLAKTEGFYLTSPDPTVRRRTADYLKVLA